MGFYMAQGVRSSIGVEKCTELVLAMIRKNKSVSVLARENGVAEATLHRWREHFLSAGEQRLKSSKAGSVESGKVAALRKELEEHKQVIGEMTIANSILKKKQTVFLDGYRSEFGG